MLESSSLALLASSKAPGGSGMPAETGSLSLSYGSSFLTLIGMRGCRVWVASGSDRE